MQNGPNLDCIGSTAHLSGGFYFLTARIFRKTDLESLKKTPQSYVLLVESFLKFSLKSSQDTVFKNDGGFRPAGSIIIDRLFVG